MSETALPQTDLQTISSCIAFFASVIKSGEPFDSSCMEMQASARSAMDRLTAEITRLREDGERMDRIEWGDCVLLADEIAHPSRRFSYRDMATPPTAESPDGTIYGPTARAVLDAAREETP